MTQPTQVYPPWLTPSPFTITNAAGVPVATETSIVYLPLTYYGPSVPLGSVFTFGGSISPASTSVASTPLTTTARSSLTTTAIPTTSLSPSASISTSTSNTARPTSITPTSAFSTRSSLSSTPTSSPSATTSSSAHFGVLTKGQLIGVIVASILGLIFLFVVALFLFLWCKGRRNRQLTTLVPQDEDRDYDVLSPRDVEGYVVDIGPVGHRVPGEGSPRHSGDEASPFLRQSRTGRPSFAETSIAGAATAISTAQGASLAVSRIPRPTATTNSSSSVSSNSHASGFGVLIDRPNQGLGYLPSMPEHPQGSETPLSTTAVRRLNIENDDEHEDFYEDGEYTGAYAYANDPLLVPPRPLNPDSPVDPFRLSDLSEAEVLTANRRRIISLLGPRTTPELPELPEILGEPRPRSSGLLGAIGLGLGGLANLGRRSWFRNFESQRQSPDYTVIPFVEKDPEVGGGTLRPDSIVDTSSRGRRLGTSADGTRSISGLSALSGASGGTIYHDAQSSIPNTPLFAPLPSAPTPASAPAVGSQPAAQQHPSAPSPLSDPAYNEEDIADALGNTDNLNLRLNFGHHSADILDIPAPAALHHFSSVSSMKETSSLGLKLPSFPPGLDTIKPVGWSDVTTEVTNSSTVGSSFGGAFLNNSISSSGRIMIDVLEDAPPGAELGWRSIASTGFGDAGTRGTFGQFIDQSGFMSEQGSLHSMRSHLNPSIRSTGSAAASRRDGSSTSSRPSAYSLARTGSISSDGRRRHHHPISPAVSAIGRSYLRPSPLSNNNLDEAPSKLPLNIVGSPPDKTSTVWSFGSTRSASAAVTVADDTGTVRGSMGLVRSGSTSRMSSASFPLNVPWAAGLDNDWVPAA